MARIACISKAIEKPDKTTEEDDVIVFKDDSHIFSPHELATFNFYSVAGDKHTVKKAAKQNLPITIIVFENSGVFTIEEKLLPAERQLIVWNDSGDRNNVYTKQLDIGV